MTTPRRSSAPEANDGRHPRSARRGAGARRESALDDLSKELRIHSISTLPERREDCLRSAAWLRDRFRRMGMTSELVEAIPGRLPVVVADWNGRPGKAHLTIYGHYDVQPGARGDGG